MKLSELATANKFFEALPEISQALPFPLFPTLVPGTPIKIAGFQVSSIRSLTVGEELACAELMGNYLEVEETPDVVYKMAIATILLKSRHDLNWKFEHTYFLPAQSIDELYRFFVSERNPEPVAEPEPEPEATTAKKPRQTSKKSSGDSSDTSPVTSDSDTAASDLALSALL